MVGNLQVDGCPPSQLDEVVLEVQVLVDDVDGVGKEVRRSASRCVRRSRQMQKREHKGKRGKVASDYSCAEGAQWQSRGGTRLRYQSEISGQS